jgi:hypothetical protein
MILMTLIQVIYTSFFKKSMAEWQGRSVNETQKWADKGRLSRYFPPANDLSFSVWPAE